MGNRSGNLSEEDKDFRFQQSINNYKKVGNKKKPKKQKQNRVYNGIPVVKGNKRKRTNNKSPLLPTIMSERPVFKIW